MYLYEIELDQKTKARGNEAEAAGAAGPQELHLSGGSSRSGPVRAVAERGAPGPDLAL